MITNTDHIRLENVPGGHRFFCEHCRAAVAIELPVPINDWLAMSTAFQRNHRHCQPQTAAATAPAEPNKEQPQ